jgi:hypothetical protein
MPIFLKEVSIELNLYSKINTLNENLIFLMNLFIRDPLGMDENLF